jgi:hypothetical protein
MGEAPEAMFGYLVMMMMMYILVVARD